MDHVQKVLSSTADTFSVLIRKMTNPTNAGASHDDPQSRFRQNSFVSASSQKRMSERYRRRKMLLRRHEQSFSTRPSLGAVVNVKIPSRSISSDKNRSNEVESTTNEEHNDSETTPLISQKSSSVQQGHSPTIENLHWATIKQNIDHGNFLVSEMLSKESELLDMDRPGESDTTNRGSAKTVEELRRQAIENLQKGSTFSPQLCLLAILLYMIISVFMFCFILEPQWTVIDSCYFAVSTFTTLGYGDLSPTSTMSVIFTTVYALAGVACLGLALGILGSKLLQTKEDRQWHENFATEYEALTMFDPDDSSCNDDDDRNDNCGSLEPVSDDGENTEIGERALHKDSSTVPMDGTLRNGNFSNCNKNVTFCSTVSMEDPEAQKQRLKVERTTSAPSSLSDSSAFSRDRRQSATMIDTRTTYHVGLVRFVVLLCVTMFFACLIGYQSGWGFWNTVYYAVITAATIGYGDLTPNTQEERFLAIIFIPLACAVTGHCLAWFAKFIIERHSEKYRKRTFDSHCELTPEDLRVMDITGDGKVAWFEFLEFMLVAMNKVDPELLDELRDYFDRLDVLKTGELSRDDLIEMARRKMKSPRRKLKLYEYKQHLLKISRQAPHKPRNQQNLDRWFGKKFDFQGSSHTSLPSQPYQEVENFAS